MKDVTERQYSTDLWSSFTILVEQLFTAIYCYLGDYPDFEGKVFKLNQCKYEDDSEPRILGIKTNAPDSGLLVLIKEGTSLEWELLEANEAEYPNSVSRVDILMWICYQLDRHRADPAYWLDEVTLKRNILQEGSHEQHPGDI